VKKEENKNKFWKTALGITTGIILAKIFFEYLWPIIFK